VARTHPRAGAKSTREQREPVARRAVRRRAFALVVVATLVAPLLTALPASAATSTFTVTTTNDLVDTAPGDGTCLAANGKCSLRAAIAEANVATGGSEITVPAGTYTLSLTSGADAGDLDITRSVTITGAARQPGPDATTIDGNGTDRILDIAGGNVTVRGVVLRNGHPATGDGGAARVAAGAALTVRDSAIHDNTAERGGGIESDGTLTVGTSALYRNQSTQRGGGIYATGSLTVGNTTLSGNTASGGGGVSSQGSTTITHATITANQAGGDSGGGVQKSGGTTTITASIVYGNVGKSGPDCIGSPNFVGVNILGSRAGCKPGGATPQTNDPQLGPLADNGGPTPTHALAATSPAVDRVTPCLAGVTTDQRGQPRPSPGGCDVGAFELVPLSVSVAFGPDGGTVGAGAATVPLADIPTTAIDTADPDASSTAAAPFGAIPFGAIPFGAIPFGAIPFGAIPFGAIPFGAIALSDVPVDYPGGWPALVSGTPLADEPIETLTLDDVVGLDSVKALPFGAIDLSGTPFGAIPFGAIALGALPLGAIPFGAIPFGAIPNEADNIDAWCAFLGQSTCDALGIGVGTGTTLVGLALAGVPFGAIPFGAIPMGAIAYDATALTGIPFGAIPLGAIPFGAIRLDATPFGAIPLGAIHVDGIVVNCPAGVETLGQAQAAGCIAPDATLADLYAQNEGNQLLYEITLGRVIPGTLDPADLPWEHLDPESTPLQHLASPRETPARFTARIDVVGATADVTLDVDLPPGFEFVASSSALGTDALSDPTPATSGTLRYTLPDLAPGTHVVTFDAWAGLVLGQTTATATVDAVAGTQHDDATDTATLTVVEAFEKGDTIDDVRPISQGTLNLAHISGSGQVDWYSFDVTDAQAAAGVRASILLSNLRIDHDLVLFGPPADPLRGAPDRHLLSVNDGSLGLDALGASLPPETLPDIPLTVPFAGVTPYRVSATDGTVDEHLETGTLVAGRYYVQVSAYNGERSDHAYALRLRLIGDPAPPATCSPRTFANPKPAPLPAPTDLAGVDTLFLVNSQRLAASFGATAASQIVTLLGDPRWSGGGVTPAIVPVDADANVRNAYATWDASRCSVDAANAVVRAIGRVLDATVAANAVANHGQSSIEHVVLIGADDQIPMARVPDGTLVANERTYGQTFASGNELRAALAAGQLLTDNAYGAARSIAVDGHELFVPELSLGRLVESPADITTALTNFLDAHGVLDPSTALVTGYDFLSDGAAAVRDALEGAGLTVDDSLISETWTADDLAAALATGPDVASINAHFDHFRALPGLGNANHDETDPFTTADVTGDLVRSLLFSMGCHAGLSASDVSLGTATPDWASTFAAAGAHWAGNTGYGYGDTEIVALSEQLMTDFARNLAAGGTTVGEAMTLAKQQYFSGLPVLTPYDEKVVHEVVFYGLPMYHLPAPAAAAGATLQSVTGPSTPTPVPGTALSSTTIDVHLDRSGPSGPSDADHLHEVLGERGRYYEVDGQTLTVQQRPVEPKVVTDVTAPGAVAHGALITSLRSTDLGSFDPVYFRPTVDLGGREPERQVGAAPFPAAMQQITTAHGSGGAQQLVLVPGQFRDPVPEGGIGTQRLFTDVGVEVLYANASDTAAAADHRAPEIVRTVASSAGGTVTLAVTTDDTAMRVVVLAKHVDDFSDVAWQRLELGRVGGTWTTSLPDVAGGWEFFVQAVDAAGNVGVSSAKTHNFRTSTAGVTGDVDITLSGGPVVDGWFTGQPVTVTITSTPTATLFFSVDGGEFAHYTAPVALGADGPHIVEARSSTGASAATIFREDRFGPTVTATTPAPGPGGWYTPATVTVGLSADDGLGSGVASLSYAVGAGSPTTVSGDTASVTVTAEGTTTVTARATDAVGNVGATSTTTVKIDRTPPTYNCGTTPTAWSATDITITCTVGDALSGATTSTVRLTTSVPAGTETANASTGTGQACDAAGNCTTIPAVTGLKVDKRGPAIAITAPSGTVTRGAVVAADFECTDGGAGIAATAGCVGTVADGASVDTSSDGTHTFTVTAKDAVGNTTTASSTYTVAAPPFNVCLLYNASKPAKPGSTFPVKLQMCNAAGQNVSSAAIVLVGQSVNGTLALKPNFSGSSNDGFLFRFTGDSYIYNLDTTGYPSGTNEMWFYVDGQPTENYKAPFKLQ
jgi:CSLREA domain-containing protein